MLKRRLFSQHPYLRNARRGERNPAARLTEAQVLNIRRDTRKQDAIAAGYEIDRATVSRIKSGSAWAWL
jgi:hypothetical protein